MSLDDTPGIRLAWAMVSGSILVSFWRASVDRDWIGLSAMKTLHLTDRDFKKQGNIFDMDLSKFVISTVDAPVISVYMQSTG